MDRNKGIWLAITGILIVGILVTLVTERFVSRREESMASSSIESSIRIADERTSGDTLPSKVEESDTTRSEASDSSAPAAVPGETPVAVLDTVVAVTEATVIGNNTSTSESTEMETVQSPLKNPKMESVVEAGGDDLGVYYKKRLDDLEVQIKRMWDGDKEGTTYSMTANAEKERKLWSNELNTIYNEIKNLLGEEEVRQLEEEERQWMKMRDAAAMEASKKYSGGSMEGLEYTLSLSSYTRDRAYDLVEIYLIDEE